MLFTLLGGGCGDFVPSKSAGHESTRIVKEVRKAATAPEPNIPIPAIYRAPPKIIEQTVGGAAEFKLFYFCRQHTSDELKTLVTTQFASKLFDAKGKSTKVVDYGVSSNPATNQLIIRCPAREDAEAVLEFLQEVDIPPIQVKISCLVSEIYADKTLDWETTLQITDMLGEQIQAIPSGRAFAVPGQITPMMTDPSVLPAFPGASLREAARARMGLKVGYLSTSGQFSAVVDILESQGYLKILMNPTLEVVNGKPAKVSSSQKVPIDKTFVRDISGTGSYIERTEWEYVVDSLQVTPHVFLDGSIGLETNILLGSKLTPEGIKQVSIITKKEIDNKENRIRPGESLIIGGLRKSERRDVVRGIPFLKDIPLLGILFSGRDFEERVVETVFILTPTISTGGMPHKEIIEEVQNKHDMSGSEYSDSETGLDLFGTKARKKEQQRKLEDAEQARLEAEAEKAKARSAVREADDKAKKAESEVKKAMAELEKVKTEALQIKADAEKAKAEAEAKAKAADEAKAAADKAAADATKTKAEAEKLAAEAKKAKIEAEKAKAADRAKAKETEAAGEAKAKAETEKPKAEAEKEKTEPEA